MRSKILSLGLVLGLLASTALGLVASAPARSDPWSRPFYADPSGPAAQVFTADPSNAVAGILADIPQVRWFTPDNPVSNIQTAVASYLAGAEAADELPVIATYSIPFRDCGSFSAGGLTSAQEYSDWVSELRAGIADTYVAVIVEPDAVTSADCLTTTQRDARYSMLSDAVSQLSAGGNVAVYLDAGHSHWLSVTELVNRLKAAGIQNARGFSLNVSNFYTTAEQEAYGEQVAAQLPGKYYVVDVSRNGAGPAPAAPLNWCNPTGRGLGGLPTRQTTAAHNDANLWIKNPGQSDGTCNRGDPYSGLWFQDRAEEMYALRANW